MFAHNRVKIHGYSRLLADLGTYTPTHFLMTSKNILDVTSYGKVRGAEFNIPPRVKKPENYHIMHIYLAGQWYECTRLLEKKAALLASLDVAVLQTYVLEGCSGSRILAAMHGSSTLRCAAGCGS